MDLVLLTLGKYYSKEMCAIEFLSFREPLATKCVSLSNKPCMARRNLINLNPIELKQYLFMIILDKYNGNCNAVDDLSTKICFPSEKKYVNV